MKKASAFVLIFLLCFVYLVILNDLTVKAEFEMIVVPDDFSDLVDAVGNATEGDTIFVKKGTYEITSPDVNNTLLLSGIEINKSLSIIGEDQENTIIVFPPDTRVGFPLLFSTKQGFNIYADNFRISNLTVTNCDYGVNVHGNGAQVSNIITSGLALQGSFSTVSKTILESQLRVIGSSQMVTQCTIRGTVDINGSQNNIVGNDVKLCYLKGSYNTISGNSFHTLFLEYSDSNLIHNNTLSSICVGSDGHECSNNTVSVNTFDGDYIWGILMCAGSYNVFHDNLIWNYNEGNSGYGIAIGGYTLVAEYNTFYRNTLKNNNRNVGANWEILGAGNFWDNGVEGNYWDDYNGTDNDGDGIGDVPHIVEGCKRDESTEMQVEFVYGQDNYPLMAPIKWFDAGIWEWTNFNVIVSSNSSIISDFSFNPDDTLIRFKVGGGYGTNRFCRITVPKNLLHTKGDWIVLVDEASVSPTIDEDTTNTYIYFTYNHNNTEIEIIGTNAIPEFPLWTILPLLIVGTLGGVTIRKKIRKQYPNP
jgi:hypothetical protein